MADEKKKEDVDPRLEYMGAYVTKTFRLKPDKWQKFSSSDDKVTTQGVNYLLETFKPFSPVCRK
jgi:hypothetical protein